MSHQAFPQNDDAIMRPLITMGDIGAPLLFDFATCRAASARRFATGT
jgi:hypothetical protein